MSSEQFQERLKFERQSIASLGYAVRSFQENNELKGSWAYTVGLRLKGAGPYGLDNTHPVCLFARGAIDANILESLLCEAADRAKDKGVVNNAEVECLELTRPSGVKAAYRFTMLELDIMEKFRELMGNVVEGQEIDTVYYWVQICDPSGLFPGQVGYQDFKQVSDMGNPVENDSLIEDFEE